MVLGANGRLGRAAVLAFSAAGWQVTAQLRRAPRAPLPAGVRRPECDALDVATLTEAARADGGVQVIVNTLNPDDTQWARRLPAITAATIELAAATGAPLMRPGSVDNHGHQLPPVLNEGTALAATHPKAAQRIALEQTLADAARVQGGRSIVIRTGDFLGDTGTWLDLGVAKGPAKGRFTLTGAELQAAFEAAPGRPLWRTRFPWPLLRLAAVAAGHAVLADAARAVRDAPPVAAPASAGRQPAAGAAGRGAADGAGGRGAAVPRGHAGRCARPGRALSPAVKT